MSEITEYTISFLKVLADQTRLQILDLLKDNAITQKDIEENLKLTQSTISQHLKTLFNSNLIKIEKKDNKKFYSVNDYEIFDLIKNIKYYVVKHNREKLSNLEDIDVDETLFK